MFNLMVFFKKNAIFQNVTFQLFFLFQEDAIKNRPSCFLLDVANISLKQHFVLPNFKESFCMSFMCFLNLVFSKQFSFFLCVLKKHLKQLFQIVFNL